MEVQLKPEIQLRLQELASISGRPIDDLIEDTLAGYLEEVAEVQSMLDSSNSGRVNPMRWG